MTEAFMEDPGARDLLPAEVDPPNAPIEEEITFGQRLADRVAAFGGSWTFISAFLLILILWVLLNSEVLAHWQEQFDPYPYILLNLFLSMLAALQAPVIMMSQNRLAVKDRLQARHDYEVNLRAELEIAVLQTRMEEVQASLARLERGLATWSDGFSESA